MSAKKLKINPKRLGNHIRSLRVHLGCLTQDDVRTQTGISKGFLSELENGKRKPSFETAAKLAQCFGVSLDSMLNACVGK